MTRALAAAALMAAFLMPAAQAHNLRCAGTDGLHKMLDQLAEQYGEATIGRGVAGGGGIMFELLTSENGATWTLLLHFADGRSCLLGNGTAWMQSEYQPPKQGPAS
jgi:hypothetical protein